MADLEQAAETELRKIIDDSAFLGLGTVAGITINATSSMRDYYDIKDVYLNYSNDPSRREIYIAATVLDHNITIIDNPTTDADIHHLKMAIAESIAPGDIKQQI